MLEEKKAVVGVPSCSTENTLLSEVLARDCLDSVIAVDDVGHDEAIEISKSLSKTKVYSRESKRGHEGNRKTCCRLGSEGVDVARLMMKTLRRGTLIKAAFLLLVIAGGAIGLAESGDPVTACFKPDQLQKIIGGAGLMGPALLVIACVVGSCFFIPGTVFVGIGTAALGPFVAFACVWPGALAAAAISFLLARTVGRAFVVAHFGDRLGRYDDSIGRNGFKTVLLLRLMFVPFAPMNFGMGLTKVRFWDFFFATALGEAATISVITFCLGGLRDVWICKDWVRLLSARTVLSLGCLVVLAIIANLVQKKFEKKTEE